MIIALHSKGDMSHSHVILGICQENEGCGVSTLCYHIDTFDRIVRELMCLNE